MLVVEKGRLVSVQQVFPHKKMHCRIPHAYPFPKVLSQIVERFRMWVENLRKQSGLP